MAWWSRFIWWKCLLFFVLGGFFGKAIADWFPDSVDNWGQSISVDEFVDLIENPAMADGQRLTEITVYPPHDGIDEAGLIIGGPHPRYAHEQGPRPLINGDTYRTSRLNAAMLRAPHLPGQPNVIGLSDAMKALTLAVPLDGFRTWNSMAEFLAVAQKRNPTLVVRHRSFLGVTREAVFTGVGAVLLGIVGSVTSARRPARVEGRPPLRLPQTQSVSLPAASGLLASSDSGSSFNLDAAIEASLMGAADLTSVAGQPSTLPPNQSDTPSLPEKSQAPKNFAGEFYPTERRLSPRPAASKAGKLLEP